MSKQSRKLPVIALSACSIPVMLAFAGTGTRSTGVQSPTVVSEDISFANDHHRDVQDDAVVSASDKKAAVAVASREWITEGLPESSSKDEYNSASWMCMSPDGDHFWVASEKDSSIATYRFVDLCDAPEQENYELVSRIDDVARQSDEWVDLQLSEDGQWLYQLFEQSETMAVYEVEGHKLELVETLTA